jgi:hypothetical protein
MRPGNRPADLERPKELLPDELLVIPMSRYLFPGVVSLVEV